LINLLEIAHKKERVISRRLASKSGIPLEEALRRTLQAIAGTRSLADLAADRRRQREQEEALRAGRKAQREHARAQKILQQQPDPDAWLAWFDGATHPNPGRMGIGGILKRPDGSVSEISFNAGTGDSSEAEYIALIAVLEAAICVGPKKLIIYGDSQVVINDVDPNARRHSTALAAKRMQAQRLIAQLPDVSLQWIPRTKNTAADALSQKAVSQISIPSRSIDSLSG
jgi:ribonuclease HI